MEISTKPLLKSKTLRITSNRVNFYADILVDPNIIKMLRNCNDYFRIDIDDSGYFKFYFEDTFVKINQPLRFIYLLKLCLFNPAVYTISMNKFRNIPSWTKISPQIRSEWVDLCNTEKIAKKCGEYVFI
jgi:hypothetical protein